MLRVIAALALTDKYRAGCGVVTRVTLKEGVTLHAERVDANIKIKIVLFIKVSIIVKYTDKYRVLKIFNLHKNLPKSTFFQKSTAINNSRSTNSSSRLANSRHRRIKKKNLKRAGKPNYVKMKSREREGGSSAKRGKEEGRDR